MPLMKYLWNDAKITTEGMIARIAPVYISCHSEVSRPTMRLIATLMVPADEESRRTREIGRASCRERAESPEVTAPATKRNKDADGSEHGVARMHLSKSTSQ